MSKQKKKRNLGDVEKRLKPFHIINSGKPYWKLTILTVGLEPVYDQFKTKPRGEILAPVEDPDFKPYDEPKGAEKEMYVLWFREIGSKINLLLNTTNRRTLIAAYGMDPFELRGKVVYLHAGKSRNGNPTIILTTEPPNGADAPPPTQDPPELQELM